MSEKSWAYVGGSVLFLLILALVVRLSCLAYVENYEYAYQFDSVSGKTTELMNSDGSSKNGYIYANPLVFIYKIDFLVFCGKGKITRFPPLILVIKGR